MANNSTCGQNSKGVPYLGPEHFLDGTWWTIQHWAWFFRKWFQRIITTKLHRASLVWRLLNIEATTFFFSTWSSSVSPPNHCQASPPLFTISSYYHSLELWTPQYKRDASTNGKSDCERRESCTATIMHDPVLSGIHWSCCGTIGIEHIIPLVVSFNRSRIRFRSRETSFQLDQKEMSTHVNKKIVQLLWFS